MSKFGGKELAGLVLWTAPRGREIKASLTGAGVKSYRTAPSYFCVLAHEMV